MGKTPIASVTYENERISILKKRQLTLHKLCVTSLLCGPWADLWPFYGVPRLGGGVPAGSTPIFRGLFQTSCYRRAKLAQL